MPPFHLPFTRRTGPVESIQANDENVRPLGSGSKGADDEFQKSVGGHGTSKSLSLSIPRRKDDLNEYKLGIVDGNGAFLPPSPPETKTSWHRSTHSASSTNHRSLLNENEPFSISRESFESYRRSFDISARSPVFQPDSSTPRISLDSRRFPRTSLINRLDRFERPPPADDDATLFEEVDLKANGDVTKPKKRGIFSRFSDTSSDGSSTHDVSRPGSSSANHRAFHFPARKRGYSGQGAELGNMPGPQAKHEMMVGEIPA